MTTMSSRLASRAARLAAVAASRAARLAAASASRTGAGDPSARATATAASRAARLAAAAASHAGGPTARAIAAAVSRAARSISSKLLDDDIAARLSFRYSTEPPDDGKCVTAKDLESDQAVWALYERWCKSYNKKRDHAEMIRRFDIFKLKASLVHNWNNYVHEDKEELARAKKRRDLGKPVDPWYLQEELGPSADGGDTVNQYWRGMLKENDQGMDLPDIQGGKKMSTED